jgi:hypothetical protein
MKTWWKGEPIIVGSLRWHILNNDLIQNIKSCLKQWKEVFNRPQTKKKSK